MPGSSLPIQTGQLSAAKVSLTPRRLPTSLAEFCARAIRALENQFVICIEVRLPAVSIVRQPKPVALGALGNQADLLGAHDRILKAPIIPWPQPPGNPGLLSAGSQQPDRAVVPEQGFGDLSTGHEFLWASKLVDASAGKRCFSAPRVAN